MIFPSEDIMTKYKLFWQYPVITEETFYKQNKNNENYIGLPWATIIDKRYNLNIILNLLKPYLIHFFNNNNSNNNTKEYYTCCQHIHFRQLLVLFKILNIKTVYSPHKIINEDILNEINIKACPLYPANIEDTRRNKLFQNIDFLSIKRKYVYSFQGAYDKQCYLTDIRDQIFKMKHPENCYIKNIGLWHYNNIVYTTKQNNDKELNETQQHINNMNEYNQLLLDSEFSLCPSGSGPNSIRLWECLAIGTIPIVLADTLELPSHELWEDAIIRIKEKDLNILPDLLLTYSETKKLEMRQNCIKLYTYFKDNYKNTKPKHIVIFSNCHGERYINIIKRDTNILHLFNINYIVSFMQLNNFEHYKNSFCNADILIINNIKNYNDYTIHNLKKYLKKECLLIIIPFVRFEGYWLPEKIKQLHYINENAVSFFPDIDINLIDDYLIYKLENKDSVLNYFTNCLKKLKDIENECDIKFYDFFIENHKKYPFFRDNYHPTSNMLEYIGKQIINIIKSKFEINYKDNNYTLKTDIYEYGHYKPIINSVKDILELEYNLDTIFICNRYNYLYTILNNELEKKLTIIDLNDMKIKLFNNYKNT